MNTYLSCDVGNGQLGCEWAVRGRVYAGGEFSLFAPSEFVETEERPPVDGWGSGWLRVEVLDADDTRVLVKLPRPAFENGQTITVGRKQIRDSIESSVV
jgi:hypothetical protein